MGTNNSKGNDNKLDDHDENLNFCKMLLMGAEDVGKSTILKQLLLLYNPKSFQASYYSNQTRHLLRRHIFEDMLQLCKASKQLFKKYPKCQVKETNRQARQEILDWNPLLWNEELVANLTTLWLDPGIQEILRFHSDQCHLSNSTSYFLNRLQDISSNNYQVTNEDIMRISIPSTGILTSEFRLAGKLFELIDASGQRGHRLKYIHKSVKIILFVVNLGGYDQRLKNAEDQNMNNHNNDNKQEQHSILKLQEDLTWWGTLSNKIRLEKIHFLLVLNQRDIFENKLQLNKSKLSDCFPDYIDPRESNYWQGFLNLLHAQDFPLPSVLAQIVYDYALCESEYALDWIEKKFRSVAPSHLKISVLVISALNPQEISQSFDKDSMLHWLDEANQGVLHDESNLLESYLH